MSIKRSQGRPIRGADVVGREKILDGARDFLRSDTSEAISRKNLAEYIGVTPALISYYFPDYSALLDAAARPVIEGYVEQLRTIVDGLSSSEDKLRKVIGLFIQCNKRDGRILDCFATLHQTKSAAVNDPLSSFSQCAYQFFAEHLESDASYQEFLYGAVWGMCRSIALLEPSTSSLDLDGDAASSISIDQTNEVYRILTSGVRRSRIRA